MNDAVLLGAVLLAPSPVVILGLYAVYRLRGPGEGWEGSFRDLLRDRTVEVLLIAVVSWTAGLATVIFLILAVAS